MVRELGRVLEKAERRFVRRDETRAERDTGSRLSAGYVVSSILRSRVDDETIVAVIDPATQELVAKVAADVATEVERRLEHRMQVHFERMEGLVGRAAEGFGATLGSIDRRLTRLETNWDTRILDHERVIKNHNERIEKLEGAGS